MNYRKMKTILSLLIVVLVFSPVFSGCTGDDSNLLDFATIVVIDSGQNRIFAIDNQDNGLNLIDALNNSIVTEDNDSLLNEDDPKMVPEFPSNAALASLPGGVSRIFVIGADPLPSQQITVLDYDDVNGLTTAPISPITVAGGSNDVLVGIDVDADRNVVFVTNSTSGNLHGFDVETGAEIAESPLAVGVGAGRIALDPDSDLMAIANSSSTSVVFLDLLDLAAGVTPLNVEVFSRDLAMATNSFGSILFLSGSAENIAKVYRLDLADLTASSEVFTLVPTTPTEPVPDPAFITGNLNQVSAGNLTDGRMGGYYTQSSGDLLVLNLPQDLTTITPAVVLVGAVSGEGIADYLNSAGEINSVYYASPGVGAVTEVNPLLNEFEDQVQ